MGKDWRDSFSESIVKKVEVLVKLAMPEEVKEWRKTAR